MVFHTLSISSVAASLLAAISAAGRWAIVTNSVVFQNNDAPRAAKTLGTVGSGIQEGQKFCRKFEAVKWKKNHLSVFCVTNLLALHDIYYSNC